jgi:hypothetical protein
MNIQDPTISRFLSKLGESYDFNSRKILVETAEKSNDLPDFMEKLAKLKLQKLQERW